jgi:hypothetical protein
VALGDGLADRLKRFDEGVDLLAAKLTYFFWNYVCDLQSSVSTHKKY